MSDARLLATDLQGSMETRLATFRKSFTCELCGGQHVVRGIAEFSPSPVATQVPRVLAPLVHPTDVPCPLLATPVGVVLELGSLAGESVRRVVVELVEVSATPNRFADTIDLNAQEEV